MPTPCITDKLLSGIWTAAVTPLNRNLSVNSELLTAHIRWLLGRGNHGVVLHGTTGEANSFSIAERLWLMDEIAAADLPAHRIMVGTGCCAIPDTVELTRRAASLGFAGSLLLPPFFYKSVSDDGLFDGIRHLIEQLDDPSYRIMLYHFPRMAGVGYSIDLVSRLITAFGRQIAALKDSSGDVEYMTRLCREFPDFSVFAGSEILMPDALRAGGAGCVSATANVTSRLIRSVFDDLMATGDSSDVELMLRFRSKLEQFPFVAALKHLLAGHSGDPTWETIRPPLRPLNSTGVEHLLHALSSLPSLPNF